MNSNSYRDKNDTELHQEFAALLREQFNLRMQRGTTGHVTKPHLFRKVRRNLARVKMLIFERKKIKTSKEE